MTNKEEILEKTLEREGGLAYFYAIEEMSELIKAIAKTFEGRGSFVDISKEVADVLITVGALKYLNPVVTAQKEKECLETLETLI